MAVAWGSTDDTNYFFWVPVFILLVAVRIATFNAYDRAVAAITTMEQLDYWERIYIIVASATNLSVGLVAAYSGLTAPHSIAPAIGMGLVGGTMISIVGRNFGSLRNARVMTYCNCVPLVIGFGLSGVINDDYLVSLSAIPVVIVIIISNNIASYLHGLLLRALKTTRQSEIASQKFVDAIGSMPNGLIMVDGNQDMVVINDQARYKLGPLLSEGRPLFDAIRELMKDPDSLIDAIRTGAIGEGIREVTYEALDGRWLRFRVSALSESTAKYLDEEWGGRQDGAYILTILDVSKNVAADREMEHLASYDGLTQIANRRFWEATTKRTVDELPDGSLVGLAVLDADRFKLINDTLGHNVGDKVIRGIAERIGMVADPRIFAGRLGGDEFVVLVSGLASIEEGRRIFDKIFSAISTTYVINSQNVEVRCSGGVIIRSKKEFNLHADMSRADMALYKVKRNPNQAWLLFDDNLEDEYQTTQRIKNDLRAAIDQGSLEVVYQPIYDAKGERIVSAEALCRWEHYDAGYIPPARFIAMAEEIGVIGKLTEYVLRTACRDCMSWNSDVGVAVNLSAIDLARDGIVEMISNALAAYSMPASRLCIEVTETVFVKDFEKTAQTLMILRNMGVKTSLDDFGTGYSSLSYLNRLPLNRVKIDRSFVIPIVEDQKAQQLFSAVVGLAKGLGYEVVVEGVEDRDQLEKVVSVAGVDMIQGYIFSRGLSNEEMRGMVEIRRPGWRDGKVIRLVAEGSKPV
ncbi:EAL domain-containing protein [Rhizobium laguerreae]|uniref:putative bifunctional diguanylate cyclase/phosphodiesterase n=1 Tax=Rhizobium laguerreae TaxID=1076926 RepID=UPI001C918508|nr:EAL domain-containing protein [Rhizobium laguerreae]MBY3151348.1 EAL domain-containing protein [Rhizobium laguerreae]